MTDFKKGDRVQITEEGEDFPNLVWLVADTHWVHGGDDVYDVQVRFGYTTRWVSSENLELIPETRVARVTARCVEDEVSVEAEWTAEEIQTIEKLARMINGASDYFMKPRLIVEVDGNEVVH